MEPFHEAGASECRHDRSARQRLVGRPGRRQLACDRPDPRGVPRLDRDDLRRRDERLGGEVRGLAVVRRYAEVLELGGPKYAARASAAWLGIQNGLCWPSLKGGVRACLTCGWAAFGDLEKRTGFSSSISSCWLAALCLPRRPAHSQPANVLRGPRRATGPRSSGPSTRSTPPRVRMSKLERHAHRAPDARTGAPARSRSGSSPLTWPLLGAVGAAAVAAALVSLWSVSRRRAAALPSSLKGGHEMRKLKGRNRTGSQDVAYPPDSDAVEPFS